MISRFCDRCKAEIPMGDIMKQKKGNFYSFSLAFHTERETCRKYGDDEIDLCVPCGKELIRQFIPKHREE